MSIKVIDLFCGCGGFSKGLIDSGCNVLAGIDIWDKAVETYQKNLNHLSFCKDLKEYSPQDFARDSGIQDVDLIVGGPPCQGFSMAGRRQSTDPRNSLFMEYVKYIDHFKPKAFVMENVVGILSMKTENNEKVVDIILRHLNKDYNCKYYKLLASDYEVPQNRRRVLFIGFRKDLNIEPTQPETVTANSHIPVKTVIIPREQIDKSYYLSQRALDGIAQKKKKMLEKNYGFGAQYLDMNKPSYTIPARYWKDGYDALVKYTDTEIRRLTPLELQRIQTFPNTYEFVGTKKDIIMQIGNAVPCKLGYHIGQYMLKKLTISSIINFSTDNNETN